MRAALNIFVAVTTWCATIFGLGIALRVAAELFKLGWNIL